MKHNNSTYFQKLEKIIAALLASTATEYRNDLIENAARQASYANKIFKASPLSIGVRSNMPLHEVKCIIDAYPLIATATTCSSSAAKQRDIMSFAKTLACGAPLSGSADIVDAELVDQIPIAEVAIASEILGIDPITSENSSNIANKLLQKYSCANHTGYLGGSVKRFHHLKGCGILKGDGLTAINAISATLEPLDITLTEAQLQSLAAATENIWNTFFSSDSDTDLDAAIDMTTSIAKGYANGSDALNALESSVSTYLSALEEQISSAEAKALEQNQNYLNSKCDVTKIKLLSAINKLPANVALAIADIQFDFSTAKSTAATCASIIAALRVEGSISDAQSWSSFLQQALPSSIKERFEL